MDNIMRMIWNRLVLVCACGSLVVGIAGCGGEVEEGVAPPPEQQQIDPASPEGQARALMNELAEHGAAGRWAEGDQTSKRLNELRPKVSPEVQEEINGALNAYQVNRATAGPGGQ